MPINNPSLQILISPNILTTLLIPTPVYSNPITKLFLLSYIGFLYIVLKPYI